MRESPVKWAVGTGIAALALVLGVIQWLFPQGGAKADPNSHPSAAVSPSPRAKSDLDKTPMIGYEFWQNGERALMQRGPDTAGYITVVTLAREPFEMHVPKPPADEAVRIVAWSDDSIFDLEQGAEYADHQQFGFGRGMANGEYFDGDLYLSREGMNYLLGNRLDELTGTMDKIRISAFSSTNIKQWTEPVYLTIFIDKNHNGKFDIAEYEYIILKFPAA